MQTVRDLAGARTLRLATTGRKSGVRRVVEVWFVVEDDTILLQAGAQGQKGWLANLRHEPRVEIELGGLHVTGTAEVLDPVEQERVAGLFRRKYWMARLARWFGSAIGRGLPVRIRIAAPAHAARDETPKAG